LQMKDQYMLFETAFKKIKNSKQLILLTFFT